MTKEERNAYQREWRKAHPEKVKASAKNHYQKNAAKHRASHSLLVKVYTGQIVKPSTCSSCNSQLHIEAHHTDYSKPYDVIWLCKSCHKKLHAEQGRG